MSNYSKTTDFEAKDSLPTGDSGKIIRGAEFETEFDAISTAIATKADTAGPTFTGTLTFATISDGTISVTAFVDEDNMASDSATLVPTQQSVKAYVDSQVTAQDLDFQADTGGALSIDLDSETMTFTGGTGIDTSGLGNAVTFAIDSTVATLTGTQTLTNKTLTSPDVNTPDIDGGTIDGTVIGGTTPAAVSATTVSATGNITVDGTVDGRDVATDGSKLDGIEAGATADQTAAEIRTLVEAATDSNVFTDADHSKLDGIEAGATGDQTNAEIRAAVEAATDSNVFTDADHSKLDGIEALADVTDTTNVTAAGALMDSELTSEASVKALNQGVATTDSPTFAAVTVNGNVEFDGLSGTGAVTVTDILDQDDMSSNSATALATQQSIKAYVDSQVSTADTLSEVLANGNTTGGTDVAVGTGDDITFADNSKAIFGAGSDLQIYHDGTNSYVRDVGTGHLNISGEEVRILNSINSEIKALFTTDGSVELYHDNAKKIETTSTGIDVTGTVVSDGLTVDASTAVVQASNAGGTTSFEISNTNGVSTANNKAALYLSATGAEANAARIESDFTGTVATNHAQDLKFYYVGLSSSPTLGMTLNSSGNVGIGTSSALFDVLTVDDTNPKISMRDSGTERAFFEVDSSDNFVINNKSASAMILETSDTERMRIDSSGLVGIGTSSPSTYDSRANNLVVGDSGDAGITIFSGASNDARLQFAPSGDTGLNNGLIGYDNANDKMSFATAGTDRMHINSSGIAVTGNVVSTGLTGSSIIQAVGADSNGFADVEIKSTGTTGSCRLFFSDTAAQSGFIRYSHSGNSMEFGTGGAERFTIDSVGNAIFTKANGAYLQFKDASAVRGAINVETSDGLVFTTGASFTERMRISSGGDVAVGTAAVTGGRYFDIYNTGSTATDFAIARFITQQVGSSSTTSADVYKRKNGEFGFANNDTNSAAYITFKVGTSDRMRIDSSGNLLVGTTITRTGNNSISLEPSNSLMYFRAAGTGSIQQAIFVRDTTGTPVSVGSIATTGTATAYNQSSDERLKENIVDAPSASDEIDAIQVRSFDWKADGSHQKYGMVAQELNTVAPDAVTIPEDPEEMAGVDYSKLVPMLVKEIQSLRARVAQLEGAN